MNTREQAGSDWEADALPTELLARGTAPSHPACGTARGLASGKAQEFREGCGELLLAEGLLEKSRAGKSGAFLGVPRLE
jgi:hypothetical protein